VGLGVAAGAYYGGYDPYGYGYSYSTYYDCPTVARRVYDGWGYRVVWINSCDYY
jgi:hypothetical protein